MPLALELRLALRCGGQWRYDSAKIAPRSEGLRGLLAPSQRAAVALPRGLAVAVQTGPHDAQDGAGEQDSEGHVGADEGGGQDGGHDGEGRRGGVGQRGEEADEGASEGREDSVLSSGGKATVVSCLC